MAELTDDRLREIVAEFGERRASSLSIAEAHALASELLKLREAVKPFATFAENNTDDEGWAGSTCQRDRICDWFGPSEFRAALTALISQETTNGN